MKAAVLTGYNKDYQDLELREIPVPTPGRDELLVKVKTAGVNPLDNMIIRGEVKLIVPYSFPLVMGNEFCGVVEATGSIVTRFVPGDRVYGRMPLKKPGAFSEYITINEDAVSIVPEYLSNQEAASVPLTALTGLQALDLLKAKPGDSLFISGGTGSLGAMVIPIAHKMGLHVITNGNGKGKERVIRLGADRFIDYKKEDYSKVLADVDFVIDSLGDRELPKEFSILKEGGHLVSLRGLPNGRFAARMGMGLGKKILFGAAGRKYDKMAAKRGQTYDFLFVEENGRQLEKIGELFNREHPLETSVDEVFALDQVNEALKKVRSGNSSGKTIISVS